MDVRWIDAPTAYRALRDGAAIVVPSVPTTLQVGDVVCIGEPWAVAVLLDQVGLLDTILRAVGV
jgi:predicted RecA/RadA family phage recombinase